MEYILEFLYAFWHLLSMIGLYVFIGLVFVGLLHLFISEEWIKKHLGENSRYGVLKGALYGIPLPLCSCGVIPLAASLRKKGASKRSVTSFFITTPMTGIDSIIATYGVFGLPMAFLRVLSSFISGLAAGFFVKEDIKDTPKGESPRSCCCSGGCGDKKLKKVSYLKKGVYYALNEVFADIVKPIFIGLLLAALFMTAVPQNGVEFLNNNLFLSYLLIFLVSLPLYVCSISAIPLALSMLSIGVSPGVVFIFLAAAPATNIITAGVIKKILGSDVLIIYLLSIISVTLCFALAIDFIFPKEWFALNSSLMERGEESLLNNILGGVFLAMILYYLARKK